MKSLILLLMCLPAGAFAQSAESRDSLYIVTYTTGPLWDNSKPPGEQSFFQEHTAFMSKLRKENITRFGARYADKGIIVVSAQSLRKVEEIIFSDDAVINKLFLADVQKLNVFYEGCVEKP